MARIKGGKKKTLTNLQIRQKDYDAMPESKKSAYKRPGSNTK